MTNTSDFYAQLNDQQKSKLIDRYTPVMFLHPLEEDFPVKPEIVIERSALWSSHGPHDIKTNWGIGNIASRAPVIERGKIPINTYSPYSYPIPEASALIEEVWLESAGWKKSDQVNVATDNRVCSSISGQKYYNLNTDGPMFYAEVCDDKTLSALFDMKHVTEQTGLDWPEFTDTIGHITIICFYFLFPNHTETAKIARSDGSLEEAANFEGDWACFSVVLNNGAHHEISEFKPLFAGFSRSRRGASSDFGTGFNQEYMELLPWDQVSKFDNHAGVVVSLGTHNLYALDAGQGEPGGIKTQWVDTGKNLGEPIGQWVTKTVKSPAGAASGAVVLAKMLGGLGIAGPLGALVGLVAGIAEAIAIQEGLHKEHEIKFDDPDVKPEEGDIEDPRDKIEHSSTATVIVPHGQNELATKLTGGTIYSNVFFWIENDAKTIVDRDKQLFWTSLLNYTNARSPASRWGVRCSDDPFDRRAGGKFPDFRIQVLKRIVEF